MKNLIYISSLVSLFALVILTSCDREPTEELESIIKEDLGYLPVISGFTLRSPAAAQVAPGSTLTLDLRFWTEDQVSEIELFAREGENEAVLVQTYPYQPAYSAISRTDSLLMSFQIPANAADSAVYVFDAVVTNENTLSRTRSLSVTVLE
ncbi:MAG: hypothetical protein ACFCUU_15815 [Cyclobacteriaceae bacterium]